MAAESILKAFSSTFPDLYTGGGGTRRDGELPLVGEEGEEGVPVVVEPVVPDAAAPDGDGKIGTIIKQFEATRTSADELNSYLQEAEEQAKQAEARALAEADLAYTPAWRNTGLPMKASHLQLDAGKMVQARLVNPKAIMHQYMEVKSKEQLHPPHTYEYNDKTIQPNYLNTTANLQTRRRRTLDDSTLDRVRGTYRKERAWPHLSGDEITQRIAESEARRRQQDLRMPPAQYDAEKKVIASMHHKLNFLRNPRYQLPPAVKLLQSQFQPAPAWGVGGTSPTRQEPTGPPIKSNMTARPDVIFVVEPEEVLFEEYEVGKVYTKTLFIRNVTHVIRSMRLFPPASQYFHLSMPRLPTDTSSIAPGMAAQVLVRFTPDSLADYDDEFAIDTATSRFPVALKARRPPPKLTLAQEMHIGEVLCGNRKVQQFSFVNRGGHGCFRIAPASYWPDRYQEAPHDMAVVGPFEVWPLYYDLAPGDEVVLNIAFEPRSMGLHQERLVMVCDNCQVKEFTIQGLASDVDVQLETIDGMTLARPSAAALHINSGLSAGSATGQSGSGTGGALPSAGSRRARASSGSGPEPLTLSTAVLDSPLWFGEVVPGSVFTRRVAVRNTTTLPFPFKWEWSSRPKTRKPRPPNMPVLGEPPAGLDFAAPSNAVDISGEDGGDAAAGQGPVSLGTFRHGELPTDRLQQQQQASHHHADAEADDYTPAGAESPKAMRGPSDMARPRGEVDLVALGLEAEAPFEISPSEGVLQPGELMEFSLTFVPPALSRYLRWAQLLVDKAHPGAGPSSCDTTVLELGMEGVAAPLDYELAPKRLVIPGVLTPGEVVRRTVTLTNRTRAPAHFDFTGMQGCVSMQPPRGVVPPLGHANVTLVFNAGDDVGPVQQVLDCNVQHGATLPLEVLAEVGFPQLELLTNRLDFGLVRLNGSETRRLRFRNTSATCATDWRLEECVQRKPNASGGAQAPGARATTPGFGDEQPTHLLFWPSNGCLGPNEEAEVDVVCHGLSDGQHHSIVKLTSPGCTLQCLEAFAAVVTPRAVVSRPKVDMGIAFLGVTARFTFTLKNLALLPLDFNFKSEGRPVEGAPGDGLPAEMRIRPESGMLMPGEELEIQVRFTPQVAGPITMYGVCDVEGAPLPTGFVVTCNSRGLDVSYDVLTPEQYKRWAAGLKNPRVRRRRDDVDNFVGMTHLPPEVISRLGSSRMAQAQPGPDPRHHVAHFGAAVPLGEIRSLYVVVTNRTPIASSLSTWLDSFGVDDVGRLSGSKKHHTKDGDASPSHTGGKQRGGAHSKAGASAAGALGDEHEADAPFLLGGGHTGSVGSPARGSAAKHAPFKLSAAHEKIKPFTSPQGNTMMAARRQQQGSASALGSKGLAVSVVPPDAQLPAWGRAVLAVSAFNDMCGDYFDVLHIKVGDLQEKRVPVRIGVSGTPLVVQKERVLRAGLHDRTSQWHTSLNWGELPATVPLQKTFYVFNTGSLDMHLAWTFYRYLDDGDCSRPDAKLFDVKLEVGARDDEETSGRDGLPDDLRSPASLMPPGMRASLATAASSNHAAANLDLAAIMAANNSAQGAEQQRVLRSSSSLLARVTNAGGGDGIEGALLGAGRSGFGPAGGSSNLAASSMTRQMSMLPEGVMLPRGASITLPSQLLIEESLSEPTFEPVRLTLARHADPDSQPFVVEPAEVVIKGGDSARFVVHFTSDRPLAHTGYLLGVQKVISREGPISLKVWPSGDTGEEVGAMFSGTFHAYAGQPPAPLKPLWVDLRADNVTARLEPDASSELSFACCSTQPPSHASYKHVITLSNRQSTPLIFALRVEGPFGITSAVPSAPQDPVLYRGTTGLSVGLPAPGQPMQQHVGWKPGFTYLPSADSIDVEVQFTPPPVDHRDDFDLAGSLVVEYDNGDVQRLPLSAHIMHPALELRHAQQLRPASASAAAAPPSADGPSSAMDGQAESSAGDGAAAEQAAAAPAEARASGTGDASASSAEPASSSSAATATLDGQEKQQQQQQRLARDAAAPLDFGHVHVQRPKPLEVTLLNPTLVDALWAVSTVDQPPKYCTPEELPKAGYSEAHIGPFTIRPACGLLGGRGIKLPRTQRVTVTFAPPDSKQYTQRVVFGASKGRPVELLLVGQGSYLETDEHQRGLFQV